MPSLTFIYYMISLAALYLRHTHTHTHTQAPGAAGRGAKTLAVVPPPPPPPSLPLLQTPPRLEVVELPCQLAPEKEFFLKKNNENPSKYGGVTPAAVA